MLNLLSGSFKAFRLFEIDVRIHFFFVLWAAFRLLSDPSSFTLIFLTLIYLIVLLHEFGHCFGARAVGGDAENILMWPLGGLAFARAPMRPWPQFVTVAAGPLVNVVFVLVSGVILTGYFGGFSPAWLNPLDGGVIQLARFSGEVWLLWLAIFYQINLFLLAFNLLPIYPLDGGQLFHTLLWPFLGLRRALVIACQVGMAGAAVFGLWGIARLGGQNDWGGGLLIMIAVFGGVTCWQRLQMAKEGYLVEDSGVEYDYLGTRGGSIWQRMFKLKPRQVRRATTAAASANPNPGGWTRKQQKEQQRAAEIDRILAKVKHEGIDSLSYVEQQTLKRATAERQREERRFGRDSSL